MDKLPRWYRRRTYLHFDFPPSVRRAIQVCCDPNQVASHAFYPFIDYSISAEKLTQDKVTGQLRRKSKTRPIAYAAHMDAQIYSYYSQMLVDAYEEEVERRGLNDVALAFRRLGKSNIDFAKTAFEEITARTPCSVVAIDVSAFFDNLGHAYLKKSWAALLGMKALPSDHYAVFKSLTRYSKVDRAALYREFDISPANPKARGYRVCSSSEFRNRVRNKGLIAIHPHDKGIPQGTPISATLSNIYMLDFDSLMLKKMRDVGGKYFRYCDDMLFVIPEEFEKKVADLAQQNLKKIDLELNKDKTKRHQFFNKQGRIRASEPLQYLGFIFDGKNVYLRSAGLARYSERMKRGVRLAKNTKVKRNNLRTKNGARPKPLYLRKLYARYSHFGKRNYIRYALRAAETFNSNSIRKQVKPLWRRLREEIEKN